MGRLSSKIYYEFTLLYYYFTVTIATWNLIIYSWKYLTKLQVIFLTSDLPQGGSKFP